MASTPRTALLAAAVVLAVLLQALVASAAAADKQVPSIHARRGGMLGRMRTLRRLDKYELQHGAEAARDSRAAGVQEHFFAQFLDHFSATDNRTWHQRYYSRSDDYLEGGPAFIYIGGEGEETASTLRKRVLFMSYLAEIYRANLFDLEHRYYGRSQPTEDLSPENLKYLSADQALADLAYFIEYLTAKGDLKQGQKVVVFGGSYPGNLAAWARAKYPHLIHAAVSSSAPVHAKADFTEYMEVVAKSIERKAGKWCNDNIKTAMDRIEELLKTKDGLRSLKKTFRIARGLDTDLDVETFFLVLSDPFAGAVQYNMDDRPNSAYNIAHVCSYLKATRPTPDQAVQNLAKVALLGAEDGVEFDWSYASMVEQYKETTIQDDTSSVGWTYQTCTEFGYYQTFSGTQTPFPRSHNKLGFYIQLCKDIFGDKFDEVLLNKAVRWSNIEFGDRNPDVTNVVFVNSNIDPWHALGILKDVNPSSKAVMVDGGSHCSDMDYPASSDSKSLTSAHAQIHSLLREALFETPASGAEVFA